MRYVMAFPLNNLTALLAIPAPKLVEAEKRSEILDVIGYQQDGQSSLGWQQAADCFDPQRQTSFGGPTAPMVIRSIPTSIAVI